MKNLIAAVFLLCSCQLFLAQEKNQFFPNDSYDTVKKVNYDDLLAKTFTKALQQGVINQTNIAMPVFKPKNLDLYSILVAPVKNESKYKILNLFENTAPKQNFFPSK